MKKKILYLAVTTALVLSSCSNDVTITEHQNLTSSDAISFRPLMNNMTRAVGITTDNLTEFYVTANNVSNPVSNNFGGETPATYTKSSTTGQILVIWILLLLRPLQVLVLHVQTQLILV